MTQYMIRKKPRRIKLDEIYGIWRSKSYGDETKNTREEEDE